MAQPPRSDFDTNIMERLNTSSRRIRQLEENIRSIRDQIKNIENDLLKQKEENSEFRTGFNKREEQINVALTNLEVEIKNINRRLRKLVSKRELNEVESFINIFNPLQSHFVTRNEVKKIINDALKRDLE